MCIPNTKPSDCPENNCQQVRNISVVANTKPHPAFIVPFPLTAAQRPNGEQFSAPVSPAAEVAGWSWESIHPSSIHLSSQPAIF